MIKHLADIGYDDTYGARPLASMFSRLVIRPLSKMILAGNYENKIIRIDINAGKIELTES